MFGGAVRSPGGTYWVARYDPLETAPQQSSVIDLSGRYLGEVALPPDCWLMAATETYVLVLGAGASGGPVCAGIRCSSRAPERRPHVLAREATSAHPLIGLRFWIPYHMVQTDVPIGEMTSLRLAPRLTSPLSSAASIP
jgi:hypothetical protein